MDRRKLYSRAAIAFSAMLVLMIFGQRATSGAAEGIDLCLRVAIPSLFPFFLFTSWVNCILPSVRIPGMRRLAQWLHIPRGGEGLLLLGLIGGYPVGAQAIHGIWKRGNLEKQQAIHMLGFCSNAGPAFIFGITRVLFPSPWISWILWLIHMLSAILTGFLLPYPPQSALKETDVQPISISQAMRQSITITTSVCGWIIIFKTLLSILAPILSSTACIYVTGLLELSAGCLQLMDITSPTMRFILAAVFLAFGGICVLMQTCSVTAGLGTGLYLPGKIIQMLISLLISIPVARICFQEFPLYSRQSLILLVIVSLLLFLLKRYSVKKLWKLQHI